jgi:hypothetical protein
MSFILTVLSILIIGDLAWWWRADRLLRPLRRSALLACRSGGLLHRANRRLLLILGSRTNPGPWEALSTAPLLSLVYIWHVIILPALLVCWLAFSIARLPVQIARWFRRRRTPGEGIQESAEGITRRRFLQTSVAVAPALLAVGATAVAFAAARALSHSTPDSPPCAASS